MLCSEEHASVFYFALNNKEAGRSSSERAGFLIFQVIKCVAKNSFSINGRSRLIAKKSKT